MNAPWKIGQSAAPELAKIVGKLSGPEMVIFLSHISTILEKRSKMKSEQYRRLWADLAEHFSDADYVAHLTVLIDES